LTFFLVDGPQECRIWTSCLGPTPHARRFVHVFLCPRTRPPTPAVPGRAQHGHLGTHLLVRPQRPPQHATRAVVTTTWQGGDGLLSAQRSDRRAGQAVATHGALRAANRAHPRCTRGAVAISSFRTQQVSIGTLFNAPLRRFREKGACTTTSSSLVHDSTMRARWAANNGASYQTRTPAGNEFTLNLCTPANRILILVGSRSREGHTSLPSPRHTTHFRCSGTPSWSSSSSPLPRVRPRFASISTALLIFRGACAGLL
jgi:hypothetical protein